jgi:hypothetical protein
MLTVQVLVYDANCCFYFLLNNQFYPTLGIYTTTSIPEGCQIH